MRSRGVSAGAAAVGVTFSDEVVAVLWPPIVDIAVEEDGTLCDNGVAGEGESVSFILSVVESEEGEVISPAGPDVKAIVEPRATVDE